MLDYAAFDAISFDCYGTLIDWEAGIAGALRPILAAHGVGCADDRLLELYARFEAPLTATRDGAAYRPYRDVLAAVADRFGVELGFQPTAADRRSLAESLGAWRPFPDTVGALRSLKRRYRLAILSNIDRDLFAGTARLLEVPFDVVVTAEDVGAYKPSARGFERLLERIGSPRERVLHVAQSLYHDIAPARHVGLATAWIDRRRGRGGAGATPPSDATPDVVFATLADLAAACGDSGA